MINKKSNKSLLSLLTPIALLIGITAISTPVLAQTGSGLQRSPWQMHRGIPNAGKKNDISDIKLKDANDPKGFEKQSIPPADDAGWTTPPRDANNNISLDEQSALSSCATQVDFTYFQTEVFIPKDTKITDFRVSFDFVDDLARIYIFNSKNKDGKYIGDGTQGKNVDSGDLLSLIVPGESNRVVISQFDACKVKNTIKNIQLEVKAGENAAEEIIPVVNRFYVDKDAKGNANGLTWTDAYTNVQDALAVSAGGNEIWVADGMYYPDVGGGKSDNDRNASFALRSGVALYGGFTGKEKALEERNWATNLTILSGDIDQNDKVYSGGIVINTNDITGTNSYHIIYMDGTTNTITSTTMLDGFVVTGGQANGEQFPQNAGGGIYCHGFEQGECSPTLTNVLIRGNMANGNGGGMFSDGRSGGKSDPALTNVIFFGNTANYGGGLYNYGGSKGTSSPVLTNVIFNGNSAKAWGGALLNQGENEGVSASALVNVTFNGNSADQGGAIFNYGDNGTSSPTLNNVILWNNTAKEAGPSIYNKNAKSTIANSIVENGAASIAGEGTHSSDYKDTNMTVDPQFVGSGNGPKNSPCGALNLKPGSPAIGMGDPKAVPAGVKTDLNGNNRIVDGKVSAGACELVK